MKLQNKGDGMRNVAAYMRQTNIRIVAGALILIFILGDGLIYVFYGAGPALMGLLCLVGGMVPVVLILLFVAIIDWSVKRANRE
jgi:hypothetical protein